jgi:3-hydroxybutyryl-CoA dehydrogenase
VTGRAAADRPSGVGVAGAGTMGAGIAQVSLLAGFPTVLYDPFPEALSRGVERLRSGLARGRERGRWSAEAETAANELLHPTTELGDLAGCDLAIEAAPERLDLKHELIARLEGVLGEGGVIATNTSSIPIAAIASAADDPGRIVGMHFFNPPPLIRLLEVVAGPDTRPEVLELARATGTRMSKSVIVVADRPGFVVNRCARPFYTEALRIVDEGSGTFEQVDRACRLGGRFRMGPFELMDLVGVDVGLEVARSFTEQSFGEPRWKPSPTQVRLVTSGRLGRKSGRGYYDYTGGDGVRDDPEPPEPRQADGEALAVLGESVVADELRARAAGCGYRVLGDAGSAALVVDAGLGRTADPSARIVLCAGGSLARRAPQACGFHLTPPLESSAMAELTRLPTTDPGAADEAERLFQRLGFVTAWVEDAPGLILGRIVSQLVNEAMFAVGEGVASTADVDAGMVLGLNHPRGPLDWGDRIGPAHVLAVLDALWRERREERYRPAPRLLRAGVTGEPLAAHGRTDVR